jgi:hypothetical protein
MGFQPDYLTGKTDFLYSSDTCRFQKVVVSTDNVPVAIMFNRVDTLPPDGGLARAEGGQGSTKPGRTNAGLCGDGCMHMPNVAELRKVVILLMPGGPPPNSCDPRGQKDDPRDRTGSRP